MFCFAPVYWGKKLVSPTFYIQDGKKFSFTQRHIQEIQVQ